MLKKKNYGFPKIHDKLIYTIFFDILNMNPVYFLDL